MIIAPNNILSTPKSKYTSCITAVSVSNLTLTAEIFSNNSTIGSTNGNARMDINVELLLSVADMIETKVKTTEIPNIPAREPTVNREKSLTGKPENTPKNKRMTTKIMDKKTKLYNSLDKRRSIGSKRV